MMIGIIAIGIIFVIGLAAWYFAAQDISESQAPSNQNLSRNNNMKITSPAFREGELIPQKYTCDGENLNPPLSFESVPGGAVSLALIMDDPDVPKNLRPSGVFGHWIVFNIPPETKVVGEGEILAGIYGSNGRGDAAYTGPCPPDREHRYFFKLYAVDTMLDLKQGASKEDVLKAMGGHILSEAQLMGRYDRDRNK